MARFVDAIDLPFSPIAAFDYLAGFEHTAEWDPGVTAARRLDPSAPLGRGSQFGVEVAFFGRRIPMLYEITAFEPPHRVVLRGTGGGVIAIDTITTAPIPGGSRITWDARLELAGLARLFDPALHLAFQWVGARAVQGLERRVAELARRERRRSASAKSRVTLVAAE
jgi:carbon monoxide dehydrogenase subunit G